MLSETESSRDFLLYAFFVVISSVKLLMSILRARARRSLSVENRLSHIMIMMETKALTKFNPKTKRKRRAEHHETSGLRRFGVGNELTTYGRPDLCSG